MQTFDFLYDDTGDIAIDNGDLVLGEVSFQNVQEVILADRGWYKFNPFIGVGLINYLNDDYTELEFLTELKLNLEADGVTVSRIDMENGTLKINLVVYRQLQPNSVGKNQNNYINPTGGVAANKGQSLFDLAMIYYNDVDAVWQLMKDKYANNGTLEYIAGDEIKSVPFVVASAWYSGTLLTGIVGDIFDEAAEFPPRTIGYEDSIYVSIGKYSINPYEPIGLDLATILDVDFRGIGYWQIGSTFKIE